MEYLQDDDPVLGLECFLCLSYHTQGPISEEWKEVQWLGEGRCSGPYSQDWVKGFELGPQGSQKNSVL